MSFSSTEVFRLITNVGVKHVLNKFIEIRGLTDLFWRLWWRNFHSQHIEVKYLCVTHTSFWLLGLIGRSQPIKHV